jgi:sterol desaturase/sphingolipid hydroxylase (fatty acid hydroxylase superfamily)
MCLQTSIDQGSKRLAFSEQVIAKPEEEKVNCDPDSDCAAVWKDHFSSLLFGGSWENTLVEHVLLVLPFCAMFFLGNDKLNVDGSMPFSEVAIFFVVASIVRRIYNAYLEAVYFTFPKYRTQPPREHKLKKLKKDLCGREIKQLEILEGHDTWTLISQALLNFAFYFALPGFYPDSVSQQSWGERFVRLVLNHYVLSFGMYWAHRACHDIPFLWEQIHSIHHWAKHPLSRNTYEDHWFDNFANAILGHAFAQILIPLDRQTFWFSHLFRILESLEKHSGVSCVFNLAHTSQQWLPFAQMPHHHDWHHEGFKGSNYTFTSIGGLWDCMFGTRKAGRYKANNYYSATKRDQTDQSKKIKTSSVNPLIILGVLTITVIVKVTNPHIFPSFSF